MVRKVVNRIYNRICRRRLFAQLPGIERKLKDYSSRSGTTGTQWITLHYAVSGILRHRPRCILEAGTGASTIVLAEAVRRLRSEDESYDGRIVSMESVREWYEVAEANLPSDCRDLVTIIHGPREKYEIALFRGYVHGNIPEAPYDYVFLDGPGYNDEFGSTFCADVLRAMEFSTAPVMRGVIDGRASSAFVLQSLFGLRCIRFHIPAMAATFSIPRLNAREPFTTTDFRSTLTGRLVLKKFLRR